MGAFSLEVGEGKRLARQWGESKDTLSSTRQEFALFPCDTDHRTTLKGVIFDIGVQHLRH